MCTAAMGRESKDPTDVSGQMRSNPPIPDASARSEPATAEFLAESGVEAGAGAEAEAELDEEFVYESIQDRQSVLAYLRALTEGIASGRLDLALGERTLQLRPRGMIEFEVQGKKRGGRVKVSFRLAWREEQKGGEALKIIAP